jgi:hypothetical protein
MSAPRAPRWVGPYVGAQLLLVVAATSLLLYQAGTLALVPGLAITGLIVMTLASWGALFESRRWAVPFEAARLVLLVAGVAWWGRLSSWG